MLLVSTDRLHESGEIHQRQQGIRGTLDLGRQGLGSFGVSIRWSAGKNDTMTPPPHTISVKQLTLWRLPPPQLTQSHVSSGCDALQAFEKLAGKPRPSLCTANKLPDPSGPMRFRLLSCKTTATWLPRQEV